MPIYGTTPDASTSQKGKVKLAGQLGGTADSPTVTGITLAPSTWSPTWTNLTVGNGTGRYYYMQIGKLVTYSVHFTFGSTSSISGAVSISLPVNAQSASDNDLSHGLALFNESGGGRRIGTSRQTAVDTVTIGWGAASGNGNPLPNQSLSSTDPFTWGADDTISWTGQYFAA